jgi:uncharacterized protein (TIGR00255 family)
MTGFASIKKKKKNMIFDLKITSVNSKFLEIKIDGIRDLYLYDLMKNIIQTEITRGKVFVQVNYDIVDKLKHEFKLDEELLMIYYKEFNRVAKKMKIKNDITIKDLVKISDGCSFKNEKSNCEIDEKDLLELLSELLEKFKINRKKEGDKLKKQFLVYLNKLEKNAESLQKLKKDYEAKLKEKIKNKLIEFHKDDVSEFDAKNIEKEINFILLKGDFEEELVRVGTHLKQLKKMLEIDESIGKKMGFLMQELNREFNTLGDKISAVKGKQLAIDSKILIDRIREQALNIE